MDLLIPLIDPSSGEGEVEHIVDWKGAVEKQGISSEKLEQMKRLVDGYEEKGRKYSGINNESFLSDKS